jgi:pimeloyl-ACP methyl ester carboxylesterase
VWDLVAAARWLRAKYDGKAPVHLAGRGYAGVLAAYAALWEEEVAGLMIADPPTTHMDVEAPQFLNVLRVCDILDTLGMLAPRPLTILGDSAEPVNKVGDIYAAADAAKSFVRKP